MTEHGPWSRARRGRSIFALVMATTAAVAIAAPAHGASAPKVRVVETEARAIVEGRVTLSVRCPGEAIRCNGTVELRAVKARATAARKAKPLPTLVGRAPLDLPGGLTARVTVELAAAWTKQLAKAKSLTTTVAITATSAGGTSIGSKSPLTVLHVPVPPRGLIVGAAEDAGRADPPAAFAITRDLGLGGIRVILRWQPGKAALAPDDVSAIGAAVVAAGGLSRVVVLATSIGGPTPRDAVGREEYCAMLRDLVVRVPGVNDVAVWMEPNKSFFWKPQFAPDGSSLAPAEYVALLARCWQVLHEAKPGVNVIGANTAPRGNDRPNAKSNISHSPGAFVRAMGAAYRSLGLTQRLFDTVGHHTYGDFAAEEPWKRHTASTTLALGDWEALMQAYYDAFEGTAQPIPGEEGISIWYLEHGYQTRPSAEKASLYAGVETDPTALADASPAGASAAGAPDQATQLTHATRLAYCQPYVGALFNFLLWDEPNLDRWQSGFLWGDRTPKGSYAAARAVFAEANARKVNCRAVPGGPLPRAFEPLPHLVVTKLAWPKSLSFNAKNDLWRLRVTPAESAAYTLSVVPVTKRGLTVKRAGKVALTKRGSVRGGSYAWLKLPRKRLAAGTYRFELVLTSIANVSREQRISSPAFTVG